MSDDDPCVRAFVRSITITPSNEATNTLIQALDPVHVTAAETAFGRG